MKTPPTAVNLSGPLPQYRQKGAMHCQLTHHSRSVRRVTRQRSSSCFIFTVTGSQQWLLPSHRFTRILHAGNKENHVKQNCIMTLSQLEKCTQRTPRKRKRDDPPTDVIGLARGVAVMRCSFERECVRIWPWTLVCVLACLCGGARCARGCACDDSSRV